MGSSFMPQKIRKKIKTIVNKLPCHNFFLFFCIYNFFIFISLLIPMKTSASWLLLMDMMAVMSFSTCIKPEDQDVQVYALSKCPRLRSH